MLLLLLLLLSLLLLVLCAAPLHTFSMQDSQQAISV